MGWRDLCSCWTFGGIIQHDRRREVELGSLTIRSHGWAVAKSHLCDWLMLLFLALIAVILHLTYPFHRYVGKDMMNGLKYPIKDNTLPVWTVPMYAVLLPITIFYLFYICRRDVHDLHHSILGIFYAVLITGLLTGAIKIASGRPRPDFFWRCFPDGIDVYDMSGNVKCHGNRKEIRVGYSSFPSGHSSWSFAGLSFLSFYLAGKIQAFDRKGHVAKLSVVFLPLVAASVVAISRVNDYKHHWHDVFAGALLGVSVASICYLQFFPPPNSENGWAPYAYFQHLKELQANAVHLATTDNMQTMEVQAVNQQARSDGNRTINHNSTIQLEEMESGRR